MSTFKSAIKLAWRDWWHEKRLSACAVLALASMLAPILVLHGVHNGVVTNLRNKLMKDPAVLVLMPTGGKGAGFDQAFIDKIAAHPACSFCIGRARDVASEMQLKSPRGETLSVTLEPTAKGDPLFEQNNQAIPLPTHPADKAAQKTDGLRGELSPSFTHSAPSAFRLASLEDIATQGIGFFGASPANAAPKDAAEAKKAEAKKKADAKKPAPKKAAGKSPAPKKSEASKAKAKPSAKQQGQAKAAAKASPQAQESPMAPLEAENPVKEQGARGVAAGAAAIATGAALAGATQGEGEAAKETPLPSAASSQQEAGASTPADASAPELAPSAPQEPEKPVEAQKPSAVQPASAPETGPDAKATTAAEYSGANPSEAKDAQGGAAQGSASTPDEAGAAPTAANQEPPLATQPAALENTPTTASGALPPQMSQTQAPAGKEKEKVSPKAERRHQIVLSAVAAKKLKVRKAGTLLTASLGRRLSSGKFHAIEPKFVVTGILPASATDRDMGFIAPELLGAIQDFRDGIDAPLLGIGGERPETENGQRHYESFRAYAKTIEDVEGLETWLRDEGVLSRTKSREIAGIRSIDSALSCVVRVIAGAAGLGFLAFMFSNVHAAVRRKWKMLGLLRLLGYSKGSLLAYPMFQSLLTGVFGITLATGIYCAVACTIDALFKGTNGLGDEVCILPLWPSFTLIALAVIALVFLASFTTAVKASKIDPATVIRGL